MIWLVREPIIVHDFPTHKGFERQCCEHVETKEEAGDVDHDIVIGEVVQHIAEGFVTKGQVS